MWCSAEREHLLQIIIVSLTIILLLICVVVIGTWDQCLWSAVPRLQTTLGSTQLPIQWVPGVFLRELSCRGVRLTTHLRLVPRLIKSVAVLLHLIYYLMAFKRITLTYYVSSSALSSLYYVHFPTIIHYKMSFGQGQTMPVRIIT